MGSSPTRDVCETGLVVMTSALHAEGPEFNPRVSYFVFDAVDS